MIWHGKNIFIFDKRKDGTFETRLPFYTKISNKGRHDKFQDLINVPRNTLMQHRRCNDKFANYKLGSLLYTSRGGLFKQIKPPLVGGHAFPLTEFVCELTHVTNGGSGGIMSTA